MTGKRFNLAWHYGLLVEMIVKSNKPYFTTKEISKKLSFSEDSIKQEFALIGYKFPFLIFEEDKVSLDPLIRMSSFITRFSLKKIRKNHYVPRSIREIFYKFALKIRSMIDVGIFLEYYLRQPDEGFKLLFKFYVRMLIGVISKYFGPITPRERFDLMNNNSRIHIGSKKFALDLNLMKKNEHYLNLKNSLKSFLPINFEIASSYLNIAVPTIKSLLASLSEIGCLRWSHKHGLYHQEMPKIHAWDLNDEHLKIILNNDFVEHLNSSLGLDLNSVIPSQELTYLFNEIFGILKSDDEIDMFRISNMLRDLDYNTEKIIFQVNGIDYVQSCQLPAQTPEEIGSLIWAVNKLPSCLKYFDPFWVYSMICKAIEESNSILFSLSDEFATLKKESQQNSFFILFLSKQIETTLLDIFHNIWLYPTKSDVPPFKVLFLEDFFDQKRLLRYLNLPKVNISPKSKNVSQSGIITLLEELLKVDKKGRRFLHIIQELPNKTGIDEKEIQEILSQFEDILFISSSGIVEFDEKKLSRRIKTELRMRR